VLVYWTALLSVYVYSRHFFAMLYQIILTIKAIAILFIPGKECVTLLDNINVSICLFQARNVLVYWAALNFDIELTKTFWKKTEEPMAMAFINKIVKKF
jgi:hypothetical protein